MTVKWNIHSLRQLSVLMVVIFLLDWHFGQFQRNPPIVSQIGNDNNAFRILAPKAKKFA
ncbi:MAG: hypothetical protein R2806_14570 [Saprospiraceae bacterium]